MQNCVEKNLIQGEIDKHEKNEAPYDPYMDISCFTIMTIEDTNSLYPRMA